MKTDILNEMAKLANTNVVSYFENNEEKQFIRIISGQWVPLIAL